MATTISTGTDFRQLMRAHKVTIRELASRMQITQKRVRMVRAYWTADPNAARDFIQGVTGQDPKGGGR